jgi:CDP-diglyceride synthetase
VAFIFASTVTSIDIGIVIMLLVITPLFHLLTNGFGYLIGVKNHPW